MASCGNRNEVTENGLNVDSADKPATTGGGGGKRRNRKKKSHGAAQNPQNSHQDNEGSSGAKNSDAASQEQKSQMSAGKQKKVGAYTALRNQLGKKAEKLQDQVMEQQIEAHLLQQQHAALSAEQATLQQQMALRQQYYAQIQQYTGLHSMTTDQGQYVGGSGGRNQNKDAQRGKSASGGGRGGSQLQQGGGRRNNSQAPRAQAKKLFEDYWSKEQVSDGLKRGTLIQGALRINPKNFMDAYVPHPDGVSDVFISGMADRNRAFNSDEVAVLINPREEWKVFMEDINHHRGEDLSTIFTDLTIDDEEEETDGPDVIVEDEDDDDANTDGDVQKTSSQSENKNCDKGNAGVEQARIESSGAAKEKTSADKKGKQNKSKGPSKRYTSLKDLCSPDVEGLSNERVRRRLNTGGGPEANMARISDKLLLRTGKVVYIIEKKHSRACTGHLKPMADKNPNVALFSPLDHRLPRIHIAMADCPAGFAERPEDFARVLYVARITDWKDCYMNAHGTLARSLGEAGEIEPETEGILMENGIDSSDFSDAVLACLPDVSTERPWKIPASELAARRDLRDQCIFTIDPSTARDLDDALSCNSLGDGVYEVGVHIADVSYFVGCANELDSVASERATSVYLVQKVIPMLPRLLCEQLCSLNPDEDRLTFSVIWTMRDTGEILDEWFGRSVIRSCVKLSYDHAQGFIEAPERDWSVEELPPISPAFSISQIRERVLDLDKIAKNLRKHRFDNGALRLDQVKLQYSLDKESGMPNGYYVYQQRDSNKLVEEFMLLANMAVAHRIYRSFPELAVLRRHPEPQSRMVDDLEATCRSLGIAMDASNSQTIQQSIAAVAGDDLDAQSRVQILTVLCSKPMQNARYFCTGSLKDQELYRHYALNVALYTHFTSPIRRYPDIMVHRLLAASLDYCPPPALSAGELMKQCEHCNDMKLNSKRVQELSSELFFSVFVKECGPLEERAMVMAVLDRSFDVLVLKLGVVKRVYCEQLPLSSYDYRLVGKRPELTLVWKDEGVRQTITIFSPVHTRLCTATDQPGIKWNAVVIHPNEAVNQDSPRAAATADAQ